MDSSLRNRAKQEKAHRNGGGADTKHPVEPVTNGAIHQGFLMFAFVFYFTISCFLMHITQFVGAPLYFINKGLYYDYMAMTKKGFGLLAVTITKWFCPTVVRISGDAETHDQISLTSDDWLYLWWISYTAGFHGRIFIILKESLKYIPVVGPGMMFFSFIFMSRNWEKDKIRMQHRLQKLNRDPDGNLVDKNQLKPMWLLIYPEGTNLSKNARPSSRKWAEKTGIPDMRHALLPRSTGLLFCLQELRDTVPWVYDCTIAYEGIPRGEYGQDVFSLRRQFFQGRGPKSVNIYWRRFAVSAIPIDDKKAFEAWILERWREKDDLLEQFMQTGRFPPNGGGAKSGRDNIGGSDFLETEVKYSTRFEFLVIYGPFVAICLAFYAGLNLWQHLRVG